MGGPRLGRLPAWWSGIYAPERVDGIVGVCTPYAPRGEVDLVEAYRRARGDATYILTFQEPGVAEAMLERDVEASFRAMLRGVGVTQEQFLAAGPEIQAIPAGCFVGEPQLFGEPVVSEEELAVYVDTYKRTGFTGGLNWYRSMRRTHEESAGAPAHIAKPGLMISAADDFFLPPAAAHGMEELVADLEKVVIPGCGHWVQQEKPAEVNRLLLDWLGRRFP